MGWGGKKKEKSKHNNVKTSDKYGEVIDSKFEARAKKAFEDAGFDFEFQYRVELFETFHVPHREKAVRRVTVTPDFYFKDFLGRELFVDTKGRSDDATCLRWKLLEMKLVREKRSYCSIWIRDDDDLFMFVKHMKRKSDALFSVGKLDY
jgi:hypothetical protein